MGKTRENLPVKTRIITTYSIAGHRDVVLCLECVTKDRQDRRRNIIKTVSIALATAIVSGIFGELFSSFSDWRGSLGTIGSIVCILSIIGAISFVFSNINSLFEDKQFQGELAAIRFEMGTLGYQAYWTTKEYKILIEHKSGNPTVLVKK